MSHAKQSVDFSLYNLMAATILTALVRELYLLSGASFLQTVDKVKETTII